MLKHILIIFAFFVCAYGAAQDIMIPVNFFDQETSNNLKTLTQYGVNKIAEIRMQSNKTKTIKYYFEIISANYKVNQDISYNIVVNIDDANCNSYDCKSERCTMHILKKSCVKVNNLTGYQCSANNMIPPGGISPMNLSDIQVINRLANLSAFAVKSIAESRANQKNRTKINYSFILISARSQVVAGSMTYLTLRIYNSSCIQNCSLEQCDLKIWEKPWENFIDLVQSNCNALPNVNYSLEWVQICSNDAIKLKSLNEFVNRINQVSNSLYYFRLYQVVKAQKQINQGTTFQFYVVVAETNCRKNQQVNLNNCKISNNAKKMACTASVIETSGTSSNLSYQIKNLNFSKFFV